jgi:hypothetical protein
MATRLYPNTTDSGIDNTRDAAWANGATGNARVLAREKAVFGTDFAGTNGSSTNPSNSLIRKWISPPLAAQTISGTFKGQMKVNEADALLNAFSQVVVKVFSSGGSLRGTLIAAHTNALSSEWPTGTATNRKAPLSALSPVSVSSLAVQDGDRIQVEFGFRATSTSTAAANIRLDGSSGGADLPEDETSTTTTAYAWFEFSQDLLWLVSTSDSGIADDFLDTFDRQYDDSGASQDLVDTLDKQVQDEATATDFVDTLERQFDDSGLGDDTASVDTGPPLEISTSDEGFAEDFLLTFDRNFSDAGVAGEEGSAGIPVAKSTSDSAVFSESAVVSVGPKPGHYRIGKFQTGEALYTIENEIIEYEQINEGGTRVNVVVVDGTEDSWTEYDRDDLIKRDYPLNAYFDLPELKTPGEVRQRAIEELQLAQRRNSPGGTVVWMPWFSKGDNIYWIDEDHNRYETRIEGIQLEFEQTLTPFQRASIDTGILVFCPPDVEEETFLARDLFNRETTDGLGTALIGGDWNII